MVRQGQKEVTNMKARRYELTDKEWSWPGRLSRSRIPGVHRKIFARISMASYGLPTVVRAGAIFQRDSVRIRLCTAASAAGGMMEP